MPAISSPATVLVTGATGYLASHIVKAYLEEGFTVIGTVRRTAGGEYLCRLFPERFSFVLVEDLTTPDALTPFVRGVDVIIHTTTRNLFPARPYDPQLIIESSVSATRNVLNSAMAPGSQVQRFVLTGSVACVTNIETHDGPREFTEADWNDGDLHEVETRGSSASDWTIYSASKVLSERAVNDFIAEKKPAFDVVRVLPYFVYGPVIHNVPNVDALTGSLLRIWRFFRYPEEHSPSEYVAGFVDVRDVARTHVEATTRPDLSGKRVLSTSRYCFVVQDFYDAYWAIPESQRPKLPFDVPRGNPGLGDTLRDSFPSFSRASQDQLGWELRGLVECVRDTLQSLLDRKLI